MADDSAVTLRTLKAHPFDLLKEIERRSLQALAGASGQSGDLEEWVGIGFRLGDEQFIVARDRVREVLMVPPFITRVPGARSWVRGLANVRGHVLPIIDLQAFLGEGPAPTGRDARVLALHGIEMPIGLIVDEVYGFRRFLDSERAEQAPRTLIRCDHFLGGAFERGVETWPVFDVDRLQTSDDFQRAAE